MRVFPLMAIPLAIYLIGVIASGEWSGAAEVDNVGNGVASLWDSVVSQMTLVSGVSLSLTWGDGLVAVALAVLVVGVIGTSFMTSRSVASVLLPVVVLGAYVVLFLTVAAFGTPTFLTLTLVAAAHTIACVAVLMRVRASERETAADV